MSISRDLYSLVVVVVHLKTMILVPLYSSGRSCRLHTKKTLWIMAMLYCTNTDLVVVRIFAEPFGQTLTYDVSAFWVRFEGGDDVSTSSNREERREGERKRV